MDQLRSSVLIVDDRAENLLALEAVLQPLASRIVKAASGEEALRALLRNDVAVIILDVNMPGMDGFQTAELIRERRRTRDIPIIFLTAHGEELQLRGYEAGAVDYIVKPYQPELMRAKVVAFLELHSKNRLLRDQTTQLHNRLSELQATQRSLASQASELARSNTALERFVQVVSHDLREPLRTLRGFLELLDERTGDDDPDARLYIGRAKASSERMLARIEDLLRSSRAADEIFTPLATDLGQVVDAVVEDLAFSINASGGRVVHGPLPTVWADPGRLAQVIQNLVSNALKFAGDDPPEVVIVAEKLEQSWVVRVQDNGIGITPHEQELIFTMFHRSGGERSEPPIHQGELDLADSGVPYEQTGWGIGLAVCRRIVEAHGGRIWVESDGRGSTFAFTMPAVPAVATHGLIASVSP